MTLLSAHGYSLSDCIRKYAQATFWVPLLIILAYSSCQKPVPPKDPDAFYHQRMIKILDSLNQEIDPLVYFNLNKRRAVILEERIRQSDESERLDLQYSYAMELLRAGLTERALVIFHQLIEELGGELGPETIFLYEMLALSYLRLGEQANCIESSTPLSCILPIQDDGIYRQQKASEVAISLYRELLYQYTEDLQTLWLYNLAHMTIGSWPDSVEPEFLLPDSIFKVQSDLPFRNISKETNLDLSGVAGGVCIEDFNGDGWLDLFVSGYLPNDPCFFFLNQGDGTFKDYTREANLTGIRGGLNLLHADYNNDGHPDVLILRGGWIPGKTLPNSLLRNNGDGTFTDVTIPAGLLSFHPTQAAGWADVDGDGWLDLFIGNETLSPKQPHPCEFYFNNGDGTFSERAKQLGIDFQSYFKGVTWGDIDQDGRPDLYLSDLNGPNRLLHNRGGKTKEKWKFVDIAPALGLTEPIHSFPTFFFDYNNDGRDDLFVSSYEMDYQSGSALPFFKDFLGQSTPGKHLCLYRNEGNLKFLDVAEELGINHITFPMGHNVGDLDGDGFVDILLGTGMPDMRALIPNRFYRNKDGQGFEDQSMGPFGHIQKGHGVAFGDIDNDGDLDVYIVTGGAFEGDEARNLFYLNETKPQAYITILLQGTLSNRSAIGAKICVEVENSSGEVSSIWTTVNTGGSFGSSSLRRTIGLGKAANIKSVMVYWPRLHAPPIPYHDLAINQSYHIIEGDSVAHPIHLSSFLFSNAQ